MNTKNPAIDAEIASMIEGMDFSNYEATQVNPTQSYPKGVYLQPPKSGIAVVYCRHGGFWTTPEGFCTHSTAQEAIDYALHPPKAPQWVHGKGERGPFGGSTYATVERVDQGWMCEVRIHIAQGYFKTREGAQAAADKLVKAIGAD